MAGCVVCNCLPSWPVVDIATGFKFCDEHFSDCRRRLADAKEQLRDDEFSLWLHVIADRRTDWLKSHIVNYNETVKKGA